MTLTAESNGVRTIRGETLWSGESLHPDTLVLDVRPPGEFLEAHIPGSTNLPLGELRQRARAVLAGVCKQRIALASNTGRKAASACVELRKAGILTDLHVLDGGLTHWREAGLPLIQGEQGISVECQAVMIAAALIVLGVLLGY